MHHPVGRTMTSRDDRSSATSDRNRRRAYDVIEAVVGAGLTTYEEIVAGMRDVRPSPVLDKRAAMLLIVEHPEERPDLIDAVAYLARLRWDAERLAIVCAEADRLAAERERRRREPGEPVDFAASLAIVEGAARRTAALDLRRAVARSRTCRRAPAPARLAVRRGCARARGRRSRPGRRTGARSVRGSEDGGGSDGPGEAGHHQRRARAVVA